METTASSTAGATPKHLWVVGILALIWNAFGAFDYVMSQMNVESYVGQFTEEQRAFMASYPSWAVAGWAVGVWGAFLGSIALLLRRSWAVYLFGVSLVGMVLAFMYSLVLADGPDMGAAEYGFTAAIWVVAIALFLYSRAMAKRGVLR
jgi:fucose permease